MTVLPEPFLREGARDQCFHLIVGDLARHPGRGASARASIRPSMNRTRHLRTDSRDSPVRAATRVSGATPPSSAHASTTRARSASDCDAVRLRDSASSDARLASDSTSGTSFGLGKYLSRISGGAH